MSVSSRIGIVWVVAALLAAGCSVEEPGIEVAPAAEQAAAAAPPGAPAREAMPVRSVVAPLDEALVSVAFVQAGLSTGLSIVDARPLEAYEAFHIPGAAHVPAHALPTSMATRVDGVVVVGSGHGAGSVPAAVDALRAKGRAVRLLDGGMQAWCRAGGAVTGVCRDEDLVDPAEVRSLVGCPGRALVVVVSPSDAGAAGRARQLVPSAEVVVASEPREVAARAAAIAQRTGARHLVVVDEAGARVAELRAALREATEAHVFFVSGGLEAVQAFESMQAAMLDRRAVVTEGRRAVRPSGGVAEDVVVRAPKGCGCR